MAATDSLRRQHAELSRMARELRTLLQPGRLAGAETDARRILADLVGMLTVHLAMEDRSMYPRLLLHPDPLVAAKAKLFVDEMGGLRPAIEAFVARWPSAAAVRAEPQDFARQTAGVLDLLEARIERENGDLYPMIDGLARK